MNKIYRIVLFIIVGLVIGLSSCGKNKLKRNIKDNNNIVKFTNYLYQKILMNFKKYHYTIKFLDHNSVYISTYED